MIASNVNPKAIHPHTLRKLQTQRASYRKKWLPYTERHRELLAKRAADREALSMKAVILQGGIIAHESEHSSTLRMA